MYMFPPHGERNRNDIFTAWNQCVSTRNKHLYNIYMYFVDFFFPFIFLSCIRGLVCTERLSLQQKISYTFSCLGGNKIKSLLLVRSWKWESNFGRPQPYEKQRQHEGHGRPAVCSGSQTCEAYLYIPSTHLHCKQTVRRTCVCLRLMNLPGKNVQWRVNDPEHKIHTNASGKAHKRAERKETLRN